MLWYAENVLKKAGLGLEPAIAIFCEHTRLSRFVRLGIVRKLHFLVVI
ncbi:hypothetical protein SAMN05216412_101450 [Nitrosospira multiformis]|uniref:Uncharacterized protein n=1 Tax=Nitrosospira multiformis TaxID=1231 RepID=A0A1H9Z1M1_9PROT|nr:hypothetical protein SAMN05216412_101450 [Nitrosospira multiformis]